MDEVLSVGIDIGGTKANIGLVTAAGKVVDKTQVLIAKKLNPEQLIVSICDETRRLMDKNGIMKETVSFFGVGVPGTADTKTGVVEYCPNLGWEDVPAGTLFKNDLGAEVCVAQDSRLAAWAEYLMGAGRGYQSLICVTLGTGIGAGIIIDGRLFHGAMNTAGELGHTVFEKDGRPCSCGNHGCLEDYCSGTGILQLALELFPEKFANLPHKSETVFQLAYAGDGDMLALIRKVVADLAVGIANAVSLLSPELVIISGGLCQHETLIIEPLRELVYQYGYHSWTRKKRLKIEKAQMGSDAPMIGAALLYRAP